LKKLAFCRPIIEQGRTGRSLRKADERMAAIRHELMAASGREEPDAVATPNLPFRISTGSYRALLRNTCCRPTADTWLSRLKADIALGRLSGILMLLY